MNSKIDTQKLRDQAQDAIAEALGDAYDCLRVWSAWGVGTMGPDDFALVTDDSDRVMEIVDAALSPVLPIIDAQAAEITALKHDIAEYVRIASEQAEEVERLRGLLSGVLVDDLVPLLSDEYIAAVQAARAALAQEQGGSDVE